MKSPYIFDVVMIDEWGTATSPTTYCRRSGVGFAESLADAAHILEDELGSDLISIKHLELLDGGEILFLPWNVLNDVMLDKYWESAPCDGMGEKLP